MRHNFLTAVMTVSLAFFAISTAFAQAPYELIRRAKALNGDACKLHSLLETVGADAHTFRSVCRLESASQELLAKLDWRHSPFEIACIVDECKLWFTRSSVGIQKDCRLHDNRLIAATLANAGRQLAILDDWVACYVRDAGRTGHHGSPNFGSPSFGNPVPDRFNRDFYNGRSGGHNIRTYEPQFERSQIGDAKTPNYPFGSAGFGQPNFGKPIVKPNFEPNRHPSFDPSIAPRAGGVRPGFSSSSSGFENANRAPVARSVIGAVLTELARTR